MIHFAVSMIPARLEHAETGHGAWDFILGGYWIIIQVIN